MSTSLFFDNETSGIPDWPKPSGAEHQPHIVQLAALLVDDTSREIIESMDCVVIHDGWTSEPEAFETHKITEEFAFEHGVPEKVVVSKFMDLWEKCDIRVAHNTTFDNRIVRIALKRFLPDRVSDEVWKDRALYFCTLMKSKKIMGGKSGHTLPEAYKHFTGKEMEGAHNAMADTKACMAIYYAMMDLDNKE